MGWGRLKLAHCRGGKKSSLNLSSSTEQHPSLKVFLKIYSPSWARGGRNTKMEREEGKAEKPESLGRGRKRRWTKKTFQSGKTGEIGFQDLFSRPFSPPLESLSSSKEKGGDGARCFFHGSIPFCLQTPNIPFAFAKNGACFKKKKGTKRPDPIPPPFLMRRKSLFHSEVEKAERENKT